MTQNNPAMLAPATRRQSPTRRPRRAMMKKSRSRRAASTRIPFDHAVPVHQGRCKRGRVHDEGADGPLRVLRRPRVDGKKDALISEWSAVVSAGCKACVLGGRRCDLDPDHLQGRQAREREPRWLYRGPQRQTDCGKAYQQVTSVASRPASESARRRRVRRVPRLLRKASTAWCKESFEHFVARVRSEPRRVRDRLQGLGVDVRGADQGPCITGKSGGDAGDGG